MIFRNRRFRFWRFIMTLSVMASLSASAQTRYFRQVKLSGPITESRINLLIQDKEGFIWIGTSSGPFRYDGFSAELFTPEGDTAAKEVRAMYAGADSVIWFGFKDGSLASYSNHIMKRFTPEEGTSSVPVSDIIKDNDGRLWWSAYGEGVYYYMDGRVYNINTEDGLTDNYTYDMELDADGWVWIGTDGGISRCKIIDGKKVVKKLGTADGLPDIIVRTIHKDKKSRMWIGLQDAGVVYYDPADKKIHEPVEGQAWEYGPVNDLAVLNGLVWAATSEDHVIEIRAAEDGSPGMFRHDLVNGEPLKFKTLLGDMQGNVWVSSGQELFISPGPRFDYYFSVQNKAIGNVHAINTDRKGDIWYASDSGLFCLDRQGKLSSYFRELTSRKTRFMCLYRDPWERLWAGTFGKGIYILDPATGNTFHITEKQGLINDNVLSIAGKEDTLWMATLAGASRCVIHKDLKNAEFESYNKTSGLGTNFIYSVYLDSKGNVWFATDGDGLIHYEKGKFKIYGEKDGLPDNVIYSVTEDKQGNIWAGTSKSGLVKYDGQTFTTYGPGKGIANLQISSIIVSNDHLLIIHSSGVDIMDLTNGRTVHYGKEINLDEFDPDLNAVYKDAGQNIWIGSRKGILKFDPSYENYLNAPIVHINTVSVFLQALQGKWDHTFSHRENHLTFNYSGLWYLDPEIVRFQVMLDGYDLDWKNTYDRLATYSSLPPGKYTFKVRAALDPAFIDSSVSEFYFQVQHPFWTSLWFIIAGVLFSASIIFWLIKIREKRLKKREEEKKEKLEFEFQVLKNQVNPHFLFNSFSTLASLIEDTPSKAIDYLEKLSDFFRNVLEYKDTKLISVDQELQVMSSYLFIQQSRYGDHLHIEIALDELIKKSLIPPMTLQMLIENAIKHNVISKDKPLHVRIFSGKDQIIVENDLQPKQLAKLSTGIGLENIRKRYKLLVNKTLMIGNQENVFRVCLPVIKNNSI